MNKFLTLVKKEVKELLTAQVILPLILTAFLFYVLGNVVGKEIEKTKAPTPIAVIDRDGTLSSSQVSQFLEKGNFKVTRYNGICISHQGDAFTQSSGERDITLPCEQGDLEVANVIEDIKKEKGSVVIQIPQGFETGIKSGQPQTIEVYKAMRNFSFIGSTDAAVVKTVLTAVNDGFSNQLIASKVSGANPVDLKNPIKEKDFVVIGDKTAETSVDKVMGFVSQQSTFIPIILFIVIMMAAQMIATSMASEKENKTLETLLSAPVGRRSIVGAKMLGAAIIAFISALVYMFGFRSYMDGMSGGAMSAGPVDAVTKAALNQLGLTLNTGDYILLGISLFGAILVALAIALILGGFAEDVKGVQGVITPLMVLLMIPYFLVLFLDFNSLSPALQWVIYAIPFSHPFLAAPNLFLGNTMPVIYGIIYEFVVFFVFLTIAAKIFSSDKIMTLKLNFGKKKI